jgi:type I restriction enzyme, S subunit
MSPSTAFPVRPAGEVGYFRGGNGFPVRYQGARNGALPFFKVSDMNSPGNEMFMTRARHYISESQRKRMGATRFPAGAIVFAKVGAAVFLERKRILAQESCIDNNLAALVVHPNVADIRYAYYQLCNFKMSSLVATTALPSLNGFQLRSVPIRLAPRLEEQRRIARTLSDTDDCISRVERLIAKKEAIKQGMMQQLLTGETRLRGFASDWKVAPLRDDVTLVSGHHVLAERCNTRGVGVPYLTGPADFPTGRIRHTKFTEHPGSLCQAGDILVTVKGSGAGTLVEADAPYCISRQLMAIRPNTWSSRFLLYSLLHNAPGIKNAVTGLIPGLARSDVLDQEIPVPPVEEQRAVAAVLSDLDAELSASGVSLTKARSIKEGIMQELLTGRTRLSLAEAVAA